uniref:Laminin subunit alpha n=2 Tax=Lygus hesperus TaxID=30085 RepID=A0A146MHL0_LYGHE
MPPPRLYLLCLLVAACLEDVLPEVLTPPYFNIAEKRKVEASYTCGEDVQEPELYCKLVGATQDYHDLDKTVISGQICDVCDPSKPDKWHPPGYAVDGAETYWISPPLSRGTEYNLINFTISLGQEFHVAYVIIKMGISPRPGLWVLERSADNGKTYKPWQYFAETVSDCEHYFGAASLELITKDDSVICTTQFSKIIPLEHGEIVVSLLNGRPSSEDFFNSTLLQEWTRATNVRLRLLRTQTLLGHLMSVEREDPTVTRRYFYSIKDISIGGRCRCNGHADVCIEKDDNPYILKCQCQHNTCGDNCDKCCENKAQKKWRQSKANALFQCEECNCNGHSEKCVYNETIDALGLSMDIHGNMEGGGQCKECRDNTEGINCEKCKPGFYKPYSKSISDKDACVPCNCQGKKYTGNCEEGSGRCECKSNYVEPFCDACVFGFTNYPECEPCHCSVMGTIGSVCDPQDNVCPCKNEFAGDRCDKCSDTYFNYPDCKECNCDAIGSLSDNCDQTTGKCDCKENYAPSKCDSCNNGYYSFPECLACTCEIRGTVEGVCSTENGTCLCKEGFDGSRCDQCVRGYKDFPNCVPCNCSDIGSSSNVCDLTGKCSCYERYSGKTCDQCSPGFYNYPDCFECGCDPQGSYGRSCNSDGYCTCKPEFEGKLCDKCKEGFYNYPLCESCDCVPAGVTKNFSGCGSQVTKGLLCECKPRVTGRRCNECKPLYWNLKEYFPEGCIDCDCFTPGVLGNIGECDDKNGGQCYCKESVVSRQCKDCADGSYNLQESNIFGCTDCGCDLGGSLDSICNKTTGACKCKNRIEGRTCNVPLEQHYFPTLHQHKFEMEDGLTSENLQVRYGSKESIFPGFSWKGYAYFSRIQDSIKMDIYIQRAALYRILFRYVNQEPDPIVGTIILRPVNAEEQVLKVVFPPSQQPAFVTVSGLTGNIPTPFIVEESTDKQWEFILNVEKGILVDYFVLMPSFYFEGNILVEEVKRPCTRQNAIDSQGRCLMFTYPTLNAYKPSYTEQAYRDNRELISETHQEDFEDLGTMAKLTPTQPAISFDLNPGKREPIVLVIDYYSPTETNDTIPLVIEVNDYNHIERGKIHLIPCRYAWACRQVVLDSAGRFGYFNRTSDKITATLMLDPNSLVIDPQIAIHSIAAIPVSEWSPGFIKLSPQYVMIDGARQVANYPPAVDLKKIEIENEPGLEKSLNIPESIFDKSAGLVSLRENPGGISVSGKVAQPGNFIFISHYTQPFHPGFKIDITVNSSGQIINGTLHPKHCPSNVGCRVTLKDLQGNRIFPVVDDFILTFKGTPDKFLWLDYVLVVPEGKFKESLMTEGPVSNVDRYREECGRDHYFIDPNNTSAFCRDSIFTVTTQFNNGALKCMCNPLGSKTLKCDKFGGQCGCKDNVIGRRCEECREGFFGFPDCKPCDCPETAHCDRRTGECQCPPNTEGELCEKCKPNTYGYDITDGCWECGCDAQGVNGTQQCDEYSGNCHCRANVAGRTCNACQPGFHDFPYCQECDCDPRGTTEGICDAETADCLCKDNVEGLVCDVCKEGSFNIDENDPKGCTECFCFNRTNTCYSSRLYRTVILDLNDWSVVTIQVKKLLNISEQPSEIEKLVDSDSIGIDLTAAPLAKQQVYFSAPGTYLGNKLTSFGGSLSYTLFCTTGVSADHLPGPDVIISGAGLHLLHYSLELPRANIETSLSVDLHPSNFQFFNGLPVNREQFMQVLQDLQAIYIRATYWENSVTTSVRQIMLETATTNYTSGSAPSLAVEECQCPPQYTGLSCEECADGYYRSSTGSFGGFCVPCQCNGHADTCDKVTGVCINCQHNTVGNHCEQCSEGYHGVATTGTMDDCLICACPLPTPSNNFASKCDFSSDGGSITCECKPGYYGDRCESCAVGYFGTPETLGSVCQPCNCSGNVDLHQNGSCDSVTGRCENCLHNTAGPACNYCKPWFFGDAVSLKNCQSCSCETCGSSRCNHSTGLCECKLNVEGEKCDRCVENHYGYDSCQGCKPCNCAEASESKQCDDRDGKCRCKPGVTGTACDKCAEGYWNYTSEGCKVCSCNEGYSEGVGCDPLTGTCHCLQGVIGEKCESCPHRWVLVKSEGGCLECDKCAHDLLDETDKINAMLQPISDEFESVALSHFSKRRLIYIDETVDAMRPKVENLTRLDISPLNELVDELENNVTRNEDMKNRAWNKVNVDVKNMQANLNTEALKVAKDAIMEAEKAVAGVIDISQGFDSGNGPKVGISNLEFDESLKEAKRVLESITKELTEVSKINQMKEEFNTTHLPKANKALEGILKLKQPQDEQEAKLLAVKKRIEVLDGKIAELKKNSQEASKKAGELLSWTKKQKDLEIPKKYEKINELNSMAQKNLATTYEILSNVTNLLSQSSNNLLMTYANDKDIFNQHSQELDNILDKNLRPEVLDQLEGQVTDALNYAYALDNQARDLQRVSMTDRNDTNAIQAYNKIVNVLRDALITAEMAKNVSESAEVTSDGIGNKAEEAEKASFDLQEQANSALDSAQAAERRLITSVGDIEKLNKTKDELQGEANWIDNTIDKISPRNPDNSIISSAERSAATIDEIRNAVGDTLTNVEELKNLSKQLVNDRSDATSAVNETSHFLEEVEDILPDVSDSTSKLSSRPKELNTLGTNLKQALTNLKKQIERARYAANKINLGVLVQPDTFLELKMPQSLPEQEINNHISLFFKSHVPDGLLFFLGNAKAVEKRAKKSVNTGDFVALELNNWQLKLIIDLGDGPTSIVSDKIISGDHWYQAVIERTGKSLRLTVIEESQNKSTVSYIKDGIVKGQATVLNIDKSSSKLFVGGMSPDFSHPSAVNYESFNGQVADVVVGDSVVGLWNFEDERNINATRKRAELEKPVPSTGCRFNGDGWVALDSKPYIRAMEKRSQVSLDFKTLAKDGLLFLSSGGSTFLSIEIREGRVLFQFNLGSNLAYIITSDPFNDGEWHHIEISRDGNRGKLKVDGRDYGVETAVGDNVKLVIPPRFYFGGYPDKHGIYEVSTINFDGCIDQVKFDSAADLSQYSESFGIKPGCPEKVASVVSFEDGAHGYVVYPKVQFDNKAMELILRFKTMATDGLIAYADFDQSSISLRLEEGQLVVFHGPGPTRLLTTQALTPYNDSQWHVVLVTYDEFSLKLIVDDSGTYNLQDPPRVRMLHGSLYFGGVPSSIDAEAAIAPKYAGCISDATLNGVIINFGNLTEVPNANIGKCVLHPKTPGRILPIPHPKPRPPIIPETSDSTTSAPVITEVPTKPPPIKRNDSDVCALPLYPKIEDSNEDVGLKLGASPSSRIEFVNLKPKIKHNYDFSIDVKTVASEGVVFFTANPRSPDYISVFIKDGKVNYGWDLGSGEALLESLTSVNDGKWHTIEFKRQGESGLLLIDGVEESEGKSSGQTKSLNVSAPFYVGGISPAVPKEKQTPLRGANNTLDGCVRNVRLNGNPFNRDKKQRLDFGVIPCSDNYESGVYFAPEGGYIEQSKNFQVAKNFQIKMDIKPRVMSGVILAIHGERDYLVLELNDGVLVVKIFSGNLTIRNSYAPPEVEVGKLCDGNWHTVTLTKFKHVVQLSVGTNHSGPTLGNKKKQTMVRTSHPLYIGGHPTMNVPGIESRKQFVGCLRLQSINNSPKEINFKGAVGNVTLNACPLT